MAHKKKIIDTDKHFEIDPITREIRNMSPSKVSVMQYDHNSERFAFTLPKSIEGHDMRECNRIEVHYINTDSATKESNTGLYKVSDLAVSPEDENILTCSWLLSQNATQKVGALSFLLRFACVDAEGNVEYAWNTGIFKGIHVSSGMYNSEIIVEQYADVLEQWKKELINSGGGVIALSDYVQKKVGFGLAAHLKGGLLNSTKSWDMISILINDEESVITIPAYTSDLENDSGFVTQQELGDIEPGEKVYDYSADTSKDLVLEHNSLYYFDVLTELTLAVSYDVDINSVTEPFECSILFKTGDSPLVITQDGITITWAGDDCDSDGVFIPETNKTYEVSIKKLGLIISARVGVI